jgi:hypothetical protein
MGRNLLAVVTVASLLVLAGCSGSSGGGTASPAGATETTDPGAAAIGQPVGTSEAGIENASALVAATGQRLTETDYAVTFVLRQGSGGQQLNVTQQVRSSLDDERRRYRFDSSGETNVVFVADGTRHIQATSDGETTYTSRELGQPFADVHAVDMLDGAESLGGILRSGTFERAGTVERDGRTLVRFDLTEFEGAGEGTTVVEANATVLVGEDGVVYSAARHIVLEEDGTTTRFDQAFRIETLGDVSVERPEWVERTDG